jgi:hypothetical protein
MSQGLDAPHGRRGPPAKAIRLTIPELFLLLADEVIE